MRELERELESTANALRSEIDEELLFFIFVYYDSTGKRPRENVATL